VTWGLYLAIVGFCFLPLTASVYAILTFALAGRFYGVPLIMTMLAAIAGVFVVGTALAWVGAILVTAPDPGESGTEPAHSSRNLVRWGMPVPIGFICLASVVGLLPLSYEVHVPVRFALLMLAAISVTVVTSALPSCLASRAKRIPDHQLARRTYRLGGVLRWVLPVFLGAMIVSFTPLSMVIPAGAGVRADVVQVFFGMTGVLVGCVVLFLLARLATMMLQYRRGFRECRAFRSLPLQGGDERSDTARR